MAGILGNIAMFKEKNFQSMHWLKVFFFKHCNVSQYAGHIALNWANDMSEQKLYRLILHLIYVSRWPNINQATNQFQIVRWTHLYERQCKIPSILSYSLLLLMPLSTLPYWNTLPWYLGPLLHKYIIFRDVEGN